MPLRSSAALRTDNRISNSALYLSMAYKRRRYGKSRRRSRRRFKGRKTGQAFRMAKAALRRSRPEWKHTDDLVASGVAVSTTTTVYDVTPDLAQGTTSLSRIGDKITYRRCQIRGHIEIPSTFSVHNARARLTLVAFKDSDAPTAASIFQTTSTTSYFRVDTAGKYRIIKDKVFILGQEGAMRSQVWFNWSFRFNKKLLYTNTTAVQANNWRLALMVLGNYGAEPLLITFRVRSRYTDV